MMVAWVSRSFFGYFPRADRIVRRSKAITGDAGASRRPGGGHGFVMAKREGFASLGLWFVSEPGELRRGGRGFGGRRVLVVR